MEGRARIFWYASPILSGFAVYVVPLMIGARDLAYPRLNAFTYWVYVASGVVWDPDQEVYFVSNMNGDPAWDTSGRPPASRTIRFARQSSSRSRRRTRS